MKHGIKIFGFALLAIVGFSAFAALLAYAVLLLWNWLMPELFAIQTINFWQALGLLALSRILFGSFRFKGRGGCCGQSQCKTWFRGKMKGQFEDKLDCMSDSDKEAFRKSFLWSCCPEEMKKKEE